VTAGDVSEARFLPRWQVADVVGAVVVVDVIRAFTTAAYAFAAGASQILLVDSIAEALALKEANPELLLMGEDGGLRPPGFDFSNSPVEVAAADLRGRVLVQRTSAGTRGVVAAKAATRLWCASLVCASATAAAVRESGLGAPTYVITGNFEDSPNKNGVDDLATARLIDRARCGDEIDADETARFVAASDEARRTLTLGHGHVDPDDIVYATRVDAFDFAMEVQRIGDRLCLDTTGR
jgi:2-phosphosulfolactate phosphatase